MASDFSLDLPLRRGSLAGEPAFLARAKRGDHDAYASLVRPYEHVAYRVAAAVTGTHVDAEEAVQNGFVKAYRSLRRFREGAAFRPWLLRIVVNEAHNVVRDRRRHARLDSRVAGQRESTGAAVDEATIAREEAATVLSALAALSVQDRLVLALRYFAELPDREAALLAGSSTEAYRVRLVRARRRLQARLEESDG